MRLPDEIVRAYAAARAAILRLADQRPTSGAFAPTISVEQLAQDAAAGLVGLGDRVGVSGHLSRAVNWYLPSGYSPYRFHTDYAVKGYEGALRLYPLPSLLPAGEIPYRHPTLSLGFLYPSTSKSLAIELGTTTVPADGLTERTPESVDDKPWFMSLGGSANMSPQPLEWVYFMGSNRLQSELPDDPPSTGRVLADPSRIRDVLQVPTESLCFPVVFERGTVPIGTDVQLSGTIGELDAEAVGELSRLEAVMHPRATAPQP